MAKKKKQKKSTEEIENQNSALLKILKDLNLDISEIESTLDINLNENKTDNSISKKQEQVENPKNEE